MNEAALLLSIGMAFGWGSPVRAAADSTLTPSASPNGSQIPSVSPMPVSTPDSKPTAIQASNNPSQADSANAEAEHRQSVQSYMWQFAKAALTPITFYGKVVDEKGNPIAGADIKIMVACNPLNFSNPGKEYQRVSNKDGLFSIKWVFGLGLVVITSKEGYYETKQSGDTFGYATGTGTSPPHKDPNKPAVFVLKKGGPIEKLIYGRDNIMFPDGGTYYYSLESGRFVNSSNAISITFSGSLPSDTKKRPLKYDWKAIIAVQGGEIMRCNADSDHFDFAAPEQGYSHEYLVDMNTEKNSWRPNFSGNFFVHFSDGRYGRFEVCNMAPAYRNGKLKYFICVESFLNPMSGHRNLWTKP